MGCFGGGKPPERPIPKRVTVKQAKDIFPEAYQFAEERMPLALTARERALADISPVLVTPEDFAAYQTFDYGRLTPEYFAKFQPTSFEEALANQYFKTVWPETERQIKHALSLSGMATSPILAEQLGKARARLGYNIGSYLAELGRRQAELALQRERDLMNLAQRRAELAIQGRQRAWLTAAGIDPVSVYGPYAETALNQANLQAQLDAAREGAKAEIEYQNALAKYNAKRSGITGLSRLGGMVLGAVAAPFTGGLSLLPAMAMGGAIGEAAAPLWGGGPASPTSFSSALEIWNKYKKPSKTVFPVYPESYTPVSIPAPSGYRGGITVPGYIST